MVLSYRTIVSNGVSKRQPSREHPACGISILQVLHRVQENLLLFTLARFAAGSSKQNVWKELRVMRQVAFQVVK